VIRAVLNSPWTVGIAIAVAVLAATAEAPAGSELAAIEASQAEDAAYRRGLTDGARLARLNCGRSLTVTSWEHQP
jgi:hypothetical protein